MDGIIDVITNNADGQYNGIIKMALIMTVFLTFIFYSVIWTNLKGQPMMAKGVPKKTKPKGEVPIDTEVEAEPVNVDQLVIRAVMFDTNIEYSKIEGHTTSTGLNARPLAESIASLIVNSSSIAEQAIEGNKNFQVGGNGFHVHGDTIEVVLDHAGGRSFDVSITQMNTLNRVNGLNGIINDGNILAIDAFNIN